jgi:hypothetical protein
LIQEDSERKDAFESELTDIQIDLQRLRLHAHVSKRFQDVRDQIRVNVLRVLSAMLDFIGQQLSYLKRFRAGFFSKIKSQYTNIPQCELLRLYSPIPINGIRMLIKNLRTA